MAERTIHSIVRFQSPFLLGEDMLPAGAYPLIVEEERLDGQGFDPWSRTSTFLVLQCRGMVELRAISQVELDNALARRRCPDDLDGEPIP